MYDLISIGSIAYDIYFQGESLTFRDGRFQLAVGGKYFVDTLHESVGGGGVNVAIGGQRNGISTAVMGIIGDNAFKPMLLSSLKKEHVSTELCLMKNNYYNISTILLTKSGERSIVNYQTPNGHLTQTDNDLIKFDQSKAVYMGNLPDVSLVERVHILRYIKSMGLMSFVNLGVKDCRRPWLDLEEMLNFVDVLIVNDHELSDLVKISYEQIDFRSNLLDRYLATTRLSTLVVTQGEKGSTGYQKNIIHHEPPPRVEKIIDTTGAGDGYTAGFISHYLKSKDIVLSMKKGSQYASVILSKVGAN